MRKAGYAVRVLAGEGSSFEQKPAPRWSNSSARSELVAKATCSSGSRPVPALKRFKAAYQLAFASLLLSARRA